MGKQDSCRKVAVTDRVANSSATEDLKLVLREARNLLVISASLSITKGNDTSDLIFDSIREVLDGTVVDGCTLTIVMVSLNKEKQW